MKETAILINVRDRPTEIALLLQSLRTQTYSDYDIYILDDCSGTPLINYHFFNCVITRLQLENHNIFMKRTDFPHGVSRARQVIVDWAMERDYKYFLRVDDDVMLEPDYIDRLLLILNKGYDLASGVTVPMHYAGIKREPKYLKGIINRVILNDEGEYIFNGDDCGMEYTESIILPAHHFRSCALIKRKVHELVKYYPTKLSKHGFREEQIFSYNAQLQGFKIGVDTGAVNYHQLTPSGGERFADSNELIKHNQQVLVEFTKENKDKLKFSKREDLDELELMKSSNLLMK